LYSDWTAVSSPAASCRSPTIFCNSGVQPWAKIEPVADCRVLESNSLQVDEAALTGESFPVEKTAAEVPAGAPLCQRTDALFMDTHVASGAGTAVVVQIGRTTEFAPVYERLATRDITTSFERGMSKFGFLLVRVMVVLVIVIFAVNLLPERPVIDAVLFSLALAVGLTPQLLPAIVAVSLSAGARRMAADRVIVKRLDAIEDFGGMTVLCTDKDRHLTAGAIRLDRAISVDGEPSVDVLRLARLDAGLQHGFANPIDDAILQGADPPDPALRVDELPYDFRRKCLSVLV
jgi:Mg2+-importing ATPase